jgi:peptide/nickel transport system permease protein
MLIYTVRRLLQMIVLLVPLSMVIFGMLALMPGDPVEMMISANPSVRPEDVERLKELYGLNDPIPVRYAKWVRQVVFKGDLGHSRVYKKPVTEIVGGRVANTLKLMAAAMVLALTLALPIGVYAAVKQYSGFDYAMMFFAFMGISVPSFWLGMVAIIVFSLWLGLFPAGGIAPPDSGVVANIRYLALPVMVLAFESLGGWSRYVRASLLEVLTQDFMRTARAKGLGESRVILRHGLRNALIPVVTVVAISIPNLFGGAVITETIFAWPGMGRLLFESVMSTDYYVALISFMILATLTLTFSIVADLAYAALDPRVRLS